MASMGFLDSLSLVYVIILSFVGAFFSTSAPQNFTPPSSASSTQVVSIKTEGINTSTPKANKKILVPEQKKSPVVQNSASLISATSSTPLPQPPAFSAEALNQKTRTALVNIFCTTKRDGDLKPITASGVVISPEGVVLTNAHVAQYYLLENYREPDFINCTIRTGSPAVDKYKAKLLYISPLWVRANKSMITAEKQVGTGENDFALLLIDKSVDSSPLPKQFSFLTLEQDDDIVMDHPETDYLIAGYPAGFLGGSAIVKDLYQISTVAKIEQVFTFYEDTLDLLSFGGSILAQRGASGGAAVSERNGKIAGIIVTTTEAKNTADRELHLVTGSHIQRSFLRSAGLSLTNFLNGDLRAELESFTLNVAPSLTLELVAKLEHQN